jgi:hypothetical protein
MTATGYKLKKGQVKIIYTIISNDLRSGPKKMKAIS